MKIWLRKYFSNFKTVRPKTGAWQIFIKSKFFKIWISKWQTSISEHVWSDWFLPKELLSICDVSICFWKIYFQTHFKFQIENFYNKYKLTVSKNNKILALNEFRSIQFHGSPTFLKRIYSRGLTQMPHRPHKAFD